MKSFIKSNLKVFVTLIISGIVFTGIGVYAASQYFAKDISFTPTNENFKKENGESIDNVEDALNELYTIGNSEYLFNGTFLTTEISTGWSGKQGINYGKTLDINFYDTHAGATDTIIISSLYDIDFSQYKKVVLKHKGISVTGIASLSLYLADDHSKVSVVSTSQEAGTIELDVSDVDITSKLYLSFTSRLSPFDERWSIIDSNKGTLNTSIESIMLVK